MFSWSKFFFSSLIGAVFAAIFLSPAVFAEAERTGCTGRITGTARSYGANAGQTYFDAHRDADGNNEGVANLSITGEAAHGLAPDNFDYAACVEEESGTVTVDGVEHEYAYALKGWAWNDNIGFISFSCQDGRNDAGNGSGVACGGIDYGVYLSSSVIYDGFRDLLGYAWSPTFGWIQFNGGTGGSEFSGEMTSNKDEIREILLGGESYRVTIDDVSRGRVNVDVNGIKRIGLAVPSRIHISGVYLHLSSAEEPTDGSPKNATYRLERPGIIYGVRITPIGGLDGFAWTQAQVYMDFSGAQIILPDMEVACEDEPELCEEPDPCEDEPWVCVEIDLEGDGGVRVADGRDAYYVHLYLRDSDGRSELLESRYPNLSDFLDSLSFVWEDTVKLDQLPAASGERNEVSDIVERNPFDAGTGAVTFKPMTFSDFVPVAGDAGHYISRDGVASYAPTSGANRSSTSSTNPIYTVSNERPVYDPSFVNRLESNELVLRRVEFEPLLGTDGLPAFRPFPVYPNGQVDMNFEFSPAIELETLYVGDLQDEMVGYRGVIETVTAALSTAGNLPAVAFGSAGVELSLGFDEEATLLQSSECGDFEFNFLRNLSGVEIESERVNSTVSALLAGGERDLQVLASIPVSEGDEAAVLPCEFARTPHLRSEISYSHEGKNIAYLSNHLPRVSEGGIFNPTAVIHGKVLTQLVGEVRAGHAVDTSGYVNVNIVRDTIHKNLREDVDTLNLLAGDCRVQSLDRVPAVSGCTRGRHYQIFAVGDERVVYFRGSNVTLDLNDGKWNNRWVVVTDGGNAFIDNNIYDPADSSAELSIVAFRDTGDDYFSTGHIYIAPGGTPHSVRNIQATMIADGTIFPYTGDHGEIDSTNGEPILPGYSEWISMQNYQLKCDCATFSRNTIGGADLDQGNQPRNYLLLGGGETLPLPVGLEERMRAQLYDLNYLRMFRTVIDTDGNGSPIDQKCGRALRPDDILAIEAGDTLCGELEPCDQSGSADQDFACDGINPLRRYSLESGVSGAGNDGDLVVPRVSGILAAGLNNDPDTGRDFDPVYVFYKAPSQDSFLFSKSGALSIN